MPQFPRARGRDPGRPGCARRSQRGAGRRYGADVPAHGVTGPDRVRARGHRADGLPRLLPGRRRHLPVRPGQQDRGRPRPWVGHRLDRRLRHRDHRADPIEHGLLFERFLNPERISPARRRPRLRRAPPRRDDPLRHRASTATTTSRRSSPSARSSPRPRSRTPRRILGYPFAIGERITKALPPAVHGQGASRSRRSSTTSTSGTARPASSARCTTTTPTSRRSSTPPAGIEGLIRGTGVHAAGVILSSEPLADVIPIHRRADDGARITGFDVPELRGHGPAEDGLPGPAEPHRHLRRRAERQGQPRRRARHARSSRWTTPRPTSCWRAGDTLGVFQLDGGAMRNLLKLMAPDPVRGHRGRPRAVPARARWKPSRTSTTRTARTAGRRSPRSTRS